MKTKKDQSKKEELINILKNNIPIIKFTVILFLLMVIIGLIFPNIQNNLQEEIIKSLLSSVEGKGYSELTLFIIKNNITVAFISILLGIIFFPLLSIIVNGYFIGAVIAKVSAKTSILKVIELFPHGIFELPAIILSFSLGLKIGLSWFKRDKMKSIRQSYKEGLIVFLYIVLPLLIIAGIIEGLLFLITRQ